MLKSGERFFTLGFCLLLVLAFSCSEIPSFAQNGGEGNGNSVKHDVPLRSQLVPENGELGEMACAATSMGMLLEFYGKTLTTPEILKSLGTNMDEGTPWGSEKEFAKKLGFANSFYMDRLSIDKLKENLRAGPMLLVIHNENDGGHTVALTGFNAKSEFFYNDPYTFSKKKMSQSKLKRIFWRAMVLKK